jgi:K(+)-stimulated pyrophosphate-energized sodium pump
MFKKNYMFFLILGLLLSLVALKPTNAWAGETNLKLPRLSLIDFHGIPGNVLLMSGILICLLGIFFGWMMYKRLKKLPAHQSLKDISEIIYTTCKTYLLQQMKFLTLLWILVGIVISIYFGFLKPIGFHQVLIILLFSILGIAGSLVVAWFGMRINNFANARSAFAALKGKAYPVYSIPLQAGISVGTLLISIELLMMLIIVLFIPGYLAGVCFVGFAIGESLGAAALRMAGGIFTKIADIGSDLMKIVFNIKEDDARNPGVIADCTGDNAGDSVGPTADGFETYGVTQVALITFILLAVSNPSNQVILLVWIFLMRILMIVTAIVSYWINSGITYFQYSKKEKFNFEAPLTQLIWITSIISIISTYGASYFIIKNLGDGTLWWKLATIISCGTLAGAIIPELVKVFTSTSSKHVQEVVTAARQGGASLNILSGFVAGNFSGFWLGVSILILMGIGAWISSFGFSTLMVAPDVFAFGLVAFGFLGMGPITIAVDSYGPVTDTSQSVFELSTIDSIPGIKQDIQSQFKFEPQFSKAKEYLEESDGTGNTFKASAKPRSIGTAVVGATTLVFSILVMLAEKASSISGALNQGQLNLIAINFSILNPLFLLGLIMGGAVIFWFSGASVQAVTTGAYRTVEFIKQHIHLDSSAAKANIEDSKRVVAICTQFAQRGMINIFIGIFSFTLAFAFFNPDFFIGYLISLAIFGLYEAIFMANAGGAWDNAKKIIETDLKEKGTPLHAACVVGDTVGDPFKDTASVSMNPIIKFTTLFGLLATELAVVSRVQAISPYLTIFFLLIALVFVWKSFFGMRIQN